MKVTAPLMGLGAAAVKVGSDFETGMSEVAAISGATSNDLKRLEEKAREMGATTKFSATEASEGLKYMAMAGWDTTQMLDGLEGVMMLAAASGENLGLVSDIVTDALTAFGMEAKEASQFADLLASASSNSNTNVAMLGESFKYVLPSLVLWVTQQKMQP
jgi:TP901 family phage tail tape measure protein